MKNVEKFVGKDVLDAIVRALDRRYELLKKSNDYVEACETDMRNHADIVARCYDKGEESVYEDRYRSGIIANSERQHDYRMLLFNFNKVVNEVIGIYDLWFEVEFKYDFDKKTHVLVEVNYDEEEL